MVLGSFTVLTEEWKARQRGNWERFCEMDPWAAYRFGCPSWMALEEWLGEGKEPFSAAFQRVNARYFPAGDPGPFRPEKRPESTVVEEFPDGVSGRGGRPKKWGSEAERKRAARARKK